MKPSLPFVEKKFDEFNRKIFSGRLPRIPLCLTEARTFRGICENKIKHNPDGSRETCDFKIRISTCFDLPETELEDVIIHEMIHYFIGFHGLVDSSPHGHLFKSLMVSINNAHKRHISISHREVSSPAQGQTDDDARGRWHVIAIIYFKDNRIGFKVLPRTSQSLLSYYDKITAIREIKKVELYLSCNAFFDQYPVSVAMKYYTVPIDTLRGKIKGAEILRVEKDRVSQTGRTANWENIRP